MPNLMQILSIFLKLQAVKQSVPGFFGLPCKHAHIVDVQLQNPTHTESENFSTWTSHPQDEAQRLHIFYVYYLFSNCLAFSNQIWYGKPPSSSPACTTTSA